MSFKRYCCCCCNEMNFLVISLTIVGMIITVIIFFISLLGLGAREAIFFHKSERDLFALFCIISSMMMLVKFISDAMIVCNLLMLTPKSYWLWVVNIVNIMWLSISLLWCTLLPEQIAIIYGGVMCCFCVYFIASQLCFYKCVNHPSMSLSITNVFSEDFENHI